MTDAVHHQSIMSNIIIFCVYLMGNVFSFCCFDELEYTRFNDDQLSYSDDKL